jgi:hypothetical protein
LPELACRVEARLLIGGERYGQGAEAGPHRHEPQTDAIVRANGCLPVVKPRRSAALGLVERVLRLDRLARRQPPISV